MVFTYKIQKWSDIQTSNTRVTVLNIGIAGNEIRNRCQPFLQAFKYYRVVGMKVSLIPASTLPADPSQISFETGENSVNPADMMNVGLIRYTNGEAFPYYKKLTGTVSTGTPSFDTDPGMQTYFNMMLDRRWSKFGLQRGVSRFFKPRVYDDGLPIQSIAPDENYSHVTQTDGTQYGVLNTRIGIDSDPDSLITQVLVPGDRQYPKLSNGDDAVFGSTNSFRFQTGRLKTLGWRTTDIAHIDGVGDTTTVSTGFNTFPFINMGRIILPRALKTKFAFRVVQTIVVQFRGPVNIPVENGKEFRYLADRGIYTPGNIISEPQNVDGGNFWGGNQV